MSKSTIWYARFKVDISHNSRFDIFKSSLGKIHLISASARILLWMEIDSKIQAPKDMRLNLPLLIYKKFSVNKRYQLQSLLIEMHLSMF